MEAVKPATGTKRYFAAGQIRVIPAPDQKTGFEGYIFPYFREMLTADPDTPFQQFLKLYHHCISTDAEEMASSMELLRRGFRFLASTAAGKVVQHIYFGMQLCIEMGGFMYLIKDGAEYTGFAIEGKGLSLLAKNKVRNSYDEDDILSALSLLSTHGTAVKRIFDAVIAISRFDGNMEEITVDECKKNPRLLRALIQARGAKDIEEIREILNEYIGQLRYQQTYWDTTPKNILRFLQAMSQNVSMKDEPMYVHIDVLTNRSSEILEYLSVFGAQAPSFYYGNTVKQLMNTGEEDPNLRLIDGKRAVPHLPYVKKGLIQSAMDWATIRRSHAIKFQGPKKQGQNAGYSDSRSRDGVIANPEFEDFYPLLRLWSYSRSNDGGGKSKGKKRATDGDDDMEEGSSKKKPKVAYSFL